MSVPRVLQHHAAANSKHGRLAHASHDAGNSMACQRSRASSIFNGLKVEGTFVERARSSASDSMVLMLSTRVSKLPHVSQSAACSFLRWLPKSFHMLPAMKQLHSVVVRDGLP